MITPYDDNYFMKQALQEADLAAEEGEVPVGAVIVCDGRIIARTHNETEKLNDVTAHAEMLAITCDSLNHKNQRRPLKKRRIFSAHSASITPFFTTVFG